MGLSLSPGHTLKPLVIWGFPSVTGSHNWTLLAGGCRKTLCSLKMKVQNERGVLFPEAPRLQRRLKYKAALFKLTNVSDKRGVRPA